MDEVAKEFSSILKDNNKKSGLKKTIFKDE